MKIPFRALIFPGALASALIVIALMGLYVYPDEAAIFYDLTIFLAVILLIGSVIMFNRRPAAQTPTNSNNATAGKIQEYLDIAQVLYVTLDNQGNVLSVNQAAAETLGLPKEQIIGMDWFEHFIPADMRDKMRHVFRKIMAAELDTTEYVENNILTAQGEQRTISWHNTILNDKTGSGCLSLSAGMDITEQANLKHKLLNTEHRLQILLDTLPYGVQEIDLTGLITYANPAHDQIFGYEHGETIGKSITDFTVSEEDKQALNAYIVHLIEQQPAPTPYQEMCIRKDGTQFILKVDWNYKRDAQGNIIGFISVMMDITDLVSTQNDLQEIEQRYQLTMQSSNSLYWIARINPYRIEYLSPAYETIWGNSIESVYSEPEIWRKSIHPQDRKLAESRLLAWINGETDHYHAEYRIVTDDKQIKWISDRGIYRNTRDGKIINIAGIADDITARRTAEIAQQESKRMLQLILDTVPIRVFWKNTESVFLGCNRLLANDAGLDSPDDIIGKTDFDFNWAEQAPMYQHDDRVVMTTGKPKLHFEEPQTTPSGDKIWLETNKIPLTDSDGHIIGILGTYDDITYRKNTERELRSSEERLRRSQRFANIGSWDWNIQTGELFWSERISALFGYEEGTLETTYENFLACIHPDDRQNVINAVNNLINNGAEYDIEHRVVWPDGSVHCLHERGDVVRGEDGTPLQMLGVVQDVTKRKQMEHALRQSTEKYTTLIEHASDAIIISTLDGKIIECNTRGEQLLEYCREELSRLSIAEIHPEHEHDAIFQCYDEIGLIGTSQFDGHILTKSGDEVPVEITGSIIEYHGMRVIVGIFRDISQRKRIEKIRLDNERRHRHTLVREVHHRIKNNLQGLIGLLRNNFDIINESSPVLDTIAKHAISQIQTIALIHGMQAKDMGANVRLCDITQAIVESIINMAHSNTTIDFRLNVTRPILLSEQEAVPIALIINELMTNAVKHMPDHLATKLINVEISMLTEERVQLIIHCHDVKLKHKIDFDNNIGIGIGLELVQALLPRSNAKLEIYDQTDGIYTSLTLEKPLFSVEHDYPAAATGKVI